MERRREGGGRQPQFTESHYEIPSWQTPWSKPWYQKTDSSNSERGKTAKTYKYNSRGHLNDCTCSLCEEDLETAFSPQSNTKQKTLFDIPKDRRQEIRIRLEEEYSGEGATTSKSKTKPPHSIGSNFNSSGNSDVPKHVYMFSELDEVTPSTTSSCNNSEGRSMNTSVSGQTHQGTSTGTSNRTSSMTHDSVMDGFGKLTAIQAISDKNRSIQERVQSFGGKSDTEEYKTMKGLLESLLRELNRINSSVGWVAMTRAIALEAIQKTLETLERKVKDAES